jgi:hypothetical protein
MKIGIAQEMTRTGALFAFGRGNLGVPLCGHREGSSQ